MLISTTHEIAGYEVLETLGIPGPGTRRCAPVTCGAHARRGAADRPGGEVVEYTTLIAQAREQALDRMKAGSLLHGRRAMR
ncbi:MAG: heavy metal-binding domain-containing protein [Planctomycetota bacterium]